MPFQPTGLYHDTDSRLYPNIHRDMAADVEYGLPDEPGLPDGPGLGGEGHSHGQDREASPSSSNSSSDQFRTSANSYTLSPEDMYDRRRGHPSHHVPDHHRALVHPGSSSIDYRPSGSRRGLGEDNLTVRRREANRLAAQRFRSRKKGYQDSLEEKVKDLEQEKEVLLRRLDELAQIAGPLPSLQGRSSALRLSRDELHVDTIRGPDVIPNTRQDPAPRRPASSERRDPPVDVDVRVAALESANRRLQEELRVITDENERMREELRAWQDWNRSARSDHVRRRHLPEGEEVSSFFSSSGNTFS